MQDTVGAVAMGTGDICFEVDNLEVDSADLFVYRSKNQNLMQFFNPNPFDICPELNERTRHSATDYNPDSTVT